MTTVHVVVPAGFDDPRRPSGGNVYDLRVCGGLRDVGWTVRLHPVPGAWPGASGAAGGRALAASLASIPGGELVLVDGLVGSGRPDVLVPEARRLRIVALVHLPFGVGALGTPAAAIVRARELAVLESCAGVITTSQWCRQWLEDHYGLPPDRVAVAQPGVDPAAASRPTTSGRRLLCVGAVTPIKGHDVLVRALAEIRDLEWTCSCVGSTAMAPGFAGRVAASARRRGIDDRVLFRGPMWGEELGSAYAAADLLVLPSRVETYGMVVAEALAHGLPVVATEVGGVTEALQRPAQVAGRHTLAEPAGVLVPSDAPMALARALRCWLTDDDLRAELRRRALARRGGLLPWSVTAQRVSEVLTAVRAAPVAR